MKRTILKLALMLPLLWLATPPASAAPPMGWLDGNPDGHNAGAGVYGLVGWALDDEGIAAVDVFVDGKIAGRAIYGESRPDVTAVFPGFPDSLLPGFRFHLDTTRFLNGLHTITAVATSITGEKTQLHGVKTVEFLNLTHNLVPFGRIEFPNNNADLRGSCNLADTERRFSVILGHALDVGVEIGDMGVGYVELLIDGAIFANSRTDCTFLPETGGFTNCFGLRRLDIEQLYPLLTSAPHSGFRFVLDIGSLIEALGFTPGKHILTVRAGDISGQVANIDEIPVTFTCDEFLGNEESFGRIGVPQNGLLYSGTINVVGWALDWEGVARATVFVDGVEVGEAIYGFGRPLVASLYPGYPNSVAAGYLFALDTTQLSDGKHHLQVIVEDVFGVTTLLGERLFEVLNP